MRKAKKLKTKKFRGGGMDASKSDFKTPGSTTKSGSYSRSYNPGAGGVVQHGGGADRKPPTLTEAVTEAGKTTNYPKRLDATKIALDKRTKLDNKMDPKAFKIDKGPFSVTAEPTDVPYKSNALVNLVASAAVPGGGFLTEGLQRASYRDKQKFARKEGLYKDFYRGTQFTTGKTLQPNSPEGKRFLKEAGYGKQPPVEKDDDLKCPPGFVNQGGVCVKIATAKKGGEIEFTKSIQSDYYKDLL